jgi:hypothetical protein
MKTRLKSGGWVEHLAVSELKGKHRDAVSVFAAMTGDAPGDGDARALRLYTVRGGLMMRNALWAVLITAWSFDLPVPALDEEQYEVTDAGSIGELPAADYDEIETLLQPHALLLLRRPDPKAGTTSSSNGSSPAKARASRTASTSGPTTTASG